MIHILWTALLLITPTAQAQEITSLPDQTLEMDVEAEALPEDGMEYQWERFRAGLQRAFTINPEKKAALYEEQLHRLDRKMTACANLGDEECLERLRARTAAMQERAQKYLEKHAELKEKLLEQFKAWREKRQARVEALRERAKELQSGSVELKKQRQLKRPAAIQHYRQNVRLYGTALPLEVRQQNQEQLIQLRSSNLKNKLDTARENAATHNRQLQDAQATY